MLAHDWMVALFFCHAASVSRASLSWPSWATVDIPVDVPEEDSASSTTPDARGLNRTRARQAPPPAPRPAPPLRGHDPPSPLPSTPASESFNSGLNGNAVAFHPGIEDDPPSRRPVGSPAPPGPANRAERHGFNRQSDGERPAGRGTGTPGESSRSGAGAEREGGVGREEGPSGTGGGAAGRRGANALDRVVTMPTGTPALSAQSPGPARSAMEEEPSRSGAVTVSAVITTDSLLPESSSLPDCSTDGAWSSAFPEYGAAPNQSQGPSRPPTPPPLPPLLVALDTDWNGAMATWGLAWELHVYGAGALFSAAAIFSALGLLGVLFLRPAGGGFLALALCFLLAAGSSRAFSLFYDAYGHEGRLLVASSALLHQAAFPCLTAAFATLFLLLSSRSRSPVLPLRSRLLWLALVLLHSGATFGPVPLLQVFPRLPRLLLLVPQGSFAALTSALSVAYLAFCCCVRADAKHVYHLDPAPTPGPAPGPARRTRPPFADPPGSWARVAVTVAFSAVLALACSVLQLYAVLHAQGLVPPLALPPALAPWPWWAFQLSCRVCEAGVCLTLVLAATPSLRCHRSPRPRPRPRPRPCPRPRRWLKALCGCRGNASPNPLVAPGDLEWEKMEMCEGAGSERLPLYTLLDTRVSSLDGLDLLYPGGRILDHAHCHAHSHLRLDSDSTGDLRPPSPIDLRRSIDEALSSDALFPRGLFAPAPGPAHRRGSGSLSLCGGTTPETPPLVESLADRSLYRTSSCREMEVGLSPIGSSLFGYAPMATGLARGAEPERRSSSGSLGRHSLKGSSQVLCSTPEGCGHCRIAPGNSPQGSLNPGVQSQGLYQVLGPASQDRLDRTAEMDLAVQEEFISVCRQIDALSVCSDTIDL